MSDGEISTTRWKLLIEYDGEPFVGWQCQPNGFSVQEALEKAIHAYSGEHIKVTAAGRTDAGVHAEGQVVHMDMARPATPKTVRDAINAHLRPLPVAVREARIVDPSFHARFSAVNRSYRYRILNRPAPATWTRRQVWHVAAPLDVARMQQAAEVLVGHHDFTSFRDSECQAKSPWRTLDRLDVRRLGEEIEVWAEARSFLHHQVRNMVGTLTLVGKGRWEVDEVRRALEAKDRKAAGPTAPAYGLTFIHVGYEDAAPG